MSASDKRSLGVFGLFVILAMLLVSFALAGEKTIRAGYVEGRATPSGVSDTSGGTLTLSGGQGRGNADPSMVVLRVPTRQASGGTLQSLTDIITMGVDQGVSIIASASISDTLTVGGTSTLTGQATFTAGLIDSTLTAGRVPYADTDSSLTDASTFTFDGTNLSVVGAGINSEIFGASAAAAGTESFAAGNSASAAGQDATAVGQGSNASAQQATCMGQDSAASNTGATSYGETASASGSQSTAIGQASTASANRAVALGRYARATTGAGATALGATSCASATDAIAIGESADALYTGAIALGADCQTDANYQFAVNNVTDMVVGRGCSGAEPWALTMRVTPADNTNTDQAGGSWTLISGAGTGDGTASQFLFQTPNLVGSGTASQTVSTRLTIDATGIDVEGNAVLDRLEWFEVSTAGVGAPNVLVDESSKVIINTGATAEAYNTLPSAAAGLIYAFVCNDDDGIRVTAAAGDTIRLGDSETAAAGYIACVNTGSTVHLLAIDSDTWFAIGSGDNFTHWSVDGSHSGYGAAAQTYISASASIDASGGDTVVGGTWSLSDASCGFTNDNGTLTYTGVADGCFLVNMSVSADIDGAGDAGQYDFKVFHNGTELTGSKAIQYYTAAAQSHPASVSIFVELSTDDTLRAYVDGSAAGTGNITVTTACLAVSALE